MTIFSFVHRWLSRVFSIEMTIKGIFKMTINGICVLSVNGWCKNTNTYLFIFSFYNFFFNLAKKWVVQKYQQSFFISSLHLPVHCWHFFTTPDVHIYKLEFSFWTITGKADKANQRVVIGLGKKSVLCKTRLYASWKRTQRSITANGVSRSLWSTLSWVLIRHLI